MTSRRLLLAVCALCSFGATEPNAATRRWPGPQIVADVNLDTPRPIFPLRSLTPLGPDRRADGAATAQVPDAWLGSWTLNVARSTYSLGPAPYKRATYRIERLGDEFRVIYDMVHPRGGTTHLEWTGRMDGRDYALQGVDQAITYAYVLVSDGACEIVVKIDGRVAARSHVTMSPDGRTMSTKTGGSTTVYEKQ